MKWFIRTTLIVGVVGATVLLLIPTHTLEEQGRIAMAAIAPGMHWEEVIAVTHAPRTLRGRIATTTADGEERIAESGSSQFIVERFREDLASLHLPYGFTFEYTYGPKVSFDVEFDGEGRVTGVRPRTDGFLLGAPSALCVISFHRTWVIV